MCGPPMSLVLTLATIVNYRTAEESYQEQEKSHIWRGKGAASQAGWRYFLETGSE